MLGKVCVTTFHRRGVPNLVLLEDLWCLIVDCGPISSQDRTWSRPGCLLRRICPPRIDDKMWLCSNGWFLKFLNTRCYGYGEDNSDFSFGIRSGKEQKQRIVYIDLNLVIYLQAHQPRSTVYDITSHNRILCRSLSSGSCRAFSCGFLSAVVPSQCGILCDICYQSLSRRRL